MAKSVGLTRATAEYLEPESLRAVDAAEKETGFITGMRFKETSLHIVSVTFYPATKFWIQDFVGDMVLGPARELTKEEFDMTTGLKL